MKKAGKEFASSRIKNFLKPTIFEAILKNIREK